MSYLDLPRICFGGTWTGNVATGNNQPFLYWLDDTRTPQSAPLIDFANVTILPIEIDGKTPTDVDLRQAMNDEDKIKGPDGKPIDGGANWSYWGQNTASFATSVTAVTTGEGGGADPLVGMTAGFVHAELCDCNPTGSQASQVFFDVFDLAGVPLDAPRANSRWVWFFRNRDMPASGGASGVFETVLPIAEEQWQALLANTGQSPAVAALHQAWKTAGTNAAGLSVRFGLYATLYDNAGETVSRDGLVSGAIGLALKSELTTFPDCRTLYNGFPAPQSLGPVLLKVNEGSKIVSIDLFTALPESGRDHATVTKKPMGHLTLALTGHGAPVTVGVIAPEQYAMTNVTQQGAIVDLDYSANAAAVQAALAGGATFTLTSDTLGPLFAEGYWAATDSRNFYLQNGNAGLIKVKVMENGRPAAGRKIDLQQFIVDYTGDNNDVGGDPVPSSDWLCNMEAPLPADADGFVTIRLTARNTGNCVVRFTLGDNPNAVDVLRDGFANIRILPNDTYDHVPDADLLGEAGFKFMYEHVMRYFYVTYPVMQPILDFSNYHVMTSAAFLKMLQKVTDPEGWWTYGYMPRTRDLSDGRRALLDRWARVNYAALYPNQ